MVVRVLVVVVGCLCDVVCWCVLVGVGACWLCVGVCGCVGVCWCV